MHFREIGLKKANGIISFGIPKKFIIGDKRLIKKSIIPELLKTPIATKSPISVGNNLKTMSIPSFAPSKKTSKTFTFSLIAIVTINVITIGIIAFDKKLIYLILTIFSLKFLQHLLQQMQHI